MLAGALWNPTRSFDRGVTTVGRFWWPWQTSAGVILRTQHMIRLLRGTLHGSKKWTIWRFMTALPVPAKWAVLVFCWPCSQGCETKKVPSTDCEPTDFQPHSTCLHLTTDKKHKRHLGLASLAVLINGNLIVPCCSLLGLAIYIVLYLVTPVMNVFVEWSVCLLVGFFFCLGFFSPFKNFFLFLYYQYFY